MIETSGVLLGLLAAFMGLGYGFALETQDEKFFTAITGIEYSKAELFFLVHTNLLGFIVGALAIGCFYKRMSRLPTILMGCSLSIVSSAVVLFWPLVSMRGWFFFHVSLTFVQALGISFCLVPLPSLIAELAERLGKPRGYLLILIQLGTAAAGFLCRSLDLLVAYPYENRQVIGSARTVLIIEQAMALLSLLCFLAAICLLRGYIEEFTAGATVYQKGSAAHLLDSQNTRYALILAIAIGAIEQFTCISLVLDESFSASDIMKRISTTDLIENYAVLESTSQHQRFLGNLMNLAAVSFALPFIEKFGRRGLLLNGCRGVAVVLFALTVVTIIFNNVEQYNVITMETAMTVLEILDILRILLIFGYQMGAGTIFWVVLGEYFPEDYKTMLGAVAFLANWMTNLVIIGLSCLNNNYIWVLYCISLVLLSLWLFVVDKSMPESTGLKLEDIQEQYFEFEEKYNIMT